MDDREILQIYDDVFAHLSLSVSKLWRADRNDPLADDLLKAALTVNERINALRAPVETAEAVVKIG